ncbi:MAG: RNA recognition motif domain-containing protein [Anaerolineae bacterium]
MSKKLYAGNLSYGTTEEELRTLFSEVGLVTSVAIIIDRETGRSKGFGFVEMATEEDAQAAIQRLHNRELGQRNITITEARPRGERPYSSGPARPGEMANRADPTGRDSRGAYYRSDGRDSRPPRSQPTEVNRVEMAREGPAYARADDRPPRPGYGRSDDRDRPAMPRDDRGAPRGVSGRDTVEKDGSARGDDGRGDRRSSRAGDRRSKTSPAFEDEWFVEKDTRSRNDRRNRDRQARDEDDMSTIDGPRRRKF